jgi:uncharacterized membrane protein YeaQ/YmgE (transglycosylase-associated protein family)
VTPWNDGTKRASALDRVPAELALVPDVIADQCNIKEMKPMDDAGIGWIAAIIIGGIAGWLAEKVMKSDMGIIMNVVLGIVGAIVANALLAIFDVTLGGWVGYLIAGFIGACVLIGVARMVRGQPALR